MDWLFSTDGFVPRSYCGNWSNIKVIFYIVPNIVIALCYWWIPINGLIYWKGHRAGLGKHTRLLLWYAAFIFWCGVTHFFDVLIFKWAAYNLNIVALNIAAAFSVKAAWHTRAFVKDAVKLPSREELHAALDNLSAQKAMKEVAFLEKEEFIKEQTKTIIRLKDMIEQKAWIHAKDETLRELNGILERMKT